MEILINGERQLLIHGALHRLFLLSHQLLILGKMLKEISLLIKRMQLTQQLVVGMTQDLL